MEADRGRVEAVYAYRDFVIAPLAKVVAQRDQNRFSGVASPPILPGDVDPVAERADSRIAKVNREIADEPTRRVLLDHEAEIIPIPLP